LTQNAEHVPFRDSKLTRILQESIGGNYKTSLIVTCSPHSFNKEETTSTLKFATRAKTIKTHYKVNIQNSPESLGQIIEKLRAELEAAKIEIATLKSGEMPTEGFETQITQYSRRKDIEASPFKDMFSVQTEGDIKGSNSQTLPKDRLVDFATKFFNLF